MIHPQSTGAPSVPMGHVHVTVATNIRHCGGCAVAATNDRKVAGSAFPDLGNEGQQPLPTGSHTGDPT